MTPEEIKARRVEYDRRYVEKHRDEILARQQAFREAHRDTLNASNREWYLNNKEKVLVKGQRWRKANPQKVKTIEARSRINNREKVLEATRKWRQENPEKAKASVDGWRNANPERMRLIKQTAEERRRAKLANCLAEGQDVTVDEWQSQLEVFGYQCAYCQSPATSLDHVVPIAKNGSHVIDNCVPCCRRCNSSKGPKSLLVWLLTSKIPQEALRSTCP